MKDPTGLPAGNEERKLCLCARYGIIRARAIIRRASGGQMSKRGPLSKHLSQISRHREVHRFTKHQPAAFKWLFKPAVLLLDSSFFYDVSSSTSDHAATLITTTRVTTSRSHHTRMDFLAFPLEIRCHIYRQCGIRRCIRPFGEAEKQIGQATADEIAKCINIVEPALLLTCHQIYDEALPIMQQRHTVLLPSGPFVASFLRKAEEKQFYSFQSVHMLVATPDLEAANSSVTDAVCTPLIPAFFNPFQDIQRIYVNNAIILVLVHQRTTTGTKPGLAGEDTACGGFCKPCVQRGELVLHIGQARRVCSDDAYVGEGTLGLLQTNLAELEMPATVRIHVSCV